MNYLIRKSKIEDMLSVEDAHRRSIREICSKDYSPNQIERFSIVKYTEDIWKNSVNKEYHIVVEVDGKIEGFCHAKMHENEEGEILGLYFTKEVIGKGIGREVVEMAFAYLDQFKPKKIVLTGTLTAKPFYERMGFKLLEEVCVPIRGADIGCFKMEIIK